MGERERPHLALAAHADWSTHAAKRWFAGALPTTAGWRVFPPRPVGPVATFLARLSARSHGGPVALGLDLPLGLPRAYAAGHATSFADFPAFLRHLATRPEFFAVCDDLSEVSPDRPFYPARPRRGVTRGAHAAALGLPDAAALSRACDRATAERPAGAPLFWTLGANQSGKAAIAGWRDLLLPALPRGILRFWPFEGAFLDLLEPRRVVVAETYPADGLRQLGLKLVGSKRRQTDRAALAPAIHAALSRLSAAPMHALSLAINDGFGADPAGEDRFDCLIGLLTLLNVLAGNRPDDTPDDPWLRRFEGWVLGQTALPR